VWDYWRDFARARPKEDSPLISHWETEAQAIKTSTTLDSDFPMKIPREKFRTQTNIPRA
jgi:hypothetical protein